MARGSKTSLSCDAPWVPLTRLCYSYPLGDGSRDRDRDQWEKVMSTGPLSDTFPGNLAGAAALWRPRQRGSRWSQDAPVGVGLSAGAVSPTARQGPLRAGLGFPVGFLSLCLYLYSLNTHRAHIRCSRGRALAASEGSRFASSVRRLPLEHRASLGAIAPAASTCETFLRNVT